MPTYIKINSKNEVVANPYTFADFQAEHPYTDFGAYRDLMYWFAKSDLATVHGYKLCALLEMPYPQCNQQTQYVISGEPQQINGEWYKTWIVQDNTPEQQEYVDRQLRQSNKQNAVNLLLETDWTDLPSVADPEKSSPFLANQREFIAYRNELRRIAVNPPVVVEIWPKKPDSVWGD